MKLLAAAFELPGPIRPRRCHDADIYMKHEDGTHVDGCYCGGLGFLYPDPPGWWAEWEGCDTPLPQWATHSWRNLLGEVIWRVLGVVEVDDE